MMSKSARQRVLVLGASGMLGSAVFRHLSVDPSLQTFGTLRDPTPLRFFTERQRASLIQNVYLDGEAGILKAFSHAKPDIVINCVGIVKQDPNTNDHLENITINASLPHRLARYTNAVGARLVHFSTDCVFSGKSGNYREEDYPDAADLYGRTKLLGEVDYGNAITLRTSIIGHELSGSRSLLNWFLSQSGEVKGFRRAIFSGFPTVEIARIIRKCVIPNPHLRGVYHLSSEPINKHELLHLFARAYGKKIVIRPDDDVVIDRSLVSDRFRAETGFAPKPWPDLVREMHADSMLNT